MSGNPAPVLTPFGPTPSVIAQQLLGGGLAVTSTATAALSGTYECSPMALAALSAEADSLTRNAGTFVDGGTSVNWPDAAGAGHNFSVAQFGTLINAVNRFVVECYQYSKGLTTTPPPATATIP